jgi:hypothetical protein
VIGISDRKYPAVPLRHPRRCAHWGHSNTRYTIGMQRARPVLAALLKHTKRACVGMACCTRLFVRICPIVATESVLGPNHDLCAQVA